MWPSMLKPATPVGAAWQHASRIFKTVDQVRLPCTSSPVVYQPECMVVTGRHGTCVKNSVVVSCYSRYCDSS